MKRIIYTVMALAAMTAASGCSGMLDDVKPKHAIPAESLTDDDLGKLTNGVLYQMENLVHAFWFDGDYLGENFGDGPGFTYSDVHADIESASSSLAKSRWQTAFTSLNQVNELLKAANNAASQSETVNTAKGTAYFFRAYIYFQLVTRYGNVPIILEPTTEVIPISEQAKVWKQIETDLGEAESYLGSFYSMYYPSKEACYALMAKVCLWQGRNSDAVTYADMVLGNSSLKPVETPEDFADMFISGTKSTETILTLANQRTTSYKRLFESVNDTDGSWNYAPSADAFSSLYNDDAYRQGDIRHAATFSDEEPLRVIKFPNGNTSMHQFIANPAPSESPLMVLRLADVYLTKAEAQGNVDGLATLDEFLKTRYENVALPTSMTESEYQNMLLDEYNREFYAEGHRWFDIKRTGRTDLYKMWNGRDFLLLWPIPQDERDLAGHDKYPQNPGYAE